MSAPSYSVLIRTFNSAKTLPRTLESLQAQSVPPAAYIFVDSGSTDETLLNLPANSIVHRYVGEEFNYADAINQGLPHVKTKYVSIVSSHTTLSVPHGMEYALMLLEQEEKMGAAYLVPDFPGPIRYEVIDRKTFNGFNGLSNSCSIIKYHLLQKRIFRREIFSAEDQEWAAWLLETEGLCTARISGAMGNNNPRRYSIRKRVNDHVCIAYYVKRNLLEWKYLAHLMGKVVYSPGPRGGMRERCFSALLIARLLSCRIMEPRGKSRYFSMRRRPCVVQKSH
ncbi:MAG: glycosyltransferase family A protein [Rhodospirillales bacterium]